MPNENRSFAGKVAFVTGAANGIGRAAAQAFAREGVSVVVADRSEQGNQEPVGRKVILWKCLQFSKVSRSRVSLKCGPAPYALGDSVS